MRLVEFTSDYDGDAWCSDGHAGTVIEDTFTFAYDDGAIGRHRTLVAPGERTPVFLMENAVRLRQVSANTDVTGLLGRITVPTLVLHCRDDGIVDFEEGRRMASMIPEARFVPLDGQNHLFLEDEPAWPRFLEEVEAFLAE